MAASLRTVVLIGNPNAGKTTLFNALTGDNQRVGNYSGVTVDVKNGEMFDPHGKKFHLLDLPGCYSLDSQTPDAKVAGDALRGRLPGERPPDLAICVVDASNLERHLQLTLQVLETGLPCVVALNMVDMAEASGVHLEPSVLAKRLGVPVIPMQATKAKGIVELKVALRSAAAVAAPAWRDDGPAETSRREFIQALCAEGARRPEEHQLTFSDQLDRWLLHPVVGWVSFLSVMFLVFWAIFSFAEIPMGWIEQGQADFGGWVESLMPPGDFRSLLVDGVIGGAGGVLVFLPQIVLLFLFIGLLESSGYMARAAYLMDGVMARAGLSGKSFLPLFSSYACAIPGIMAARSIDSPKERLTTIFIAPWMSCSARLPVYFLIVPLLLHEEEGSWKQALVLFAIYALGTVTAFVVARVVRGRLGPDEQQAHFMLELPPYRKPQWRYIIRHVGSRAGSFIRKAGTIILGLSILLWALSTYPKHAGDDQSEALEHSAMGRIGAVIEPVVRPLGFDGRTGTAVLTSFAAREVFVSSMAVLFRAKETDDELESRNLLRDRITDAKRDDGSPLFTPLTMVSLLIFYIYALQCLPTTAIVAKESNSWRWAGLQFVFMTGFAYVAAFLVFQGGQLLGF